MNKDSNEVWSDRRPMGMSRIGFMKALGVGACAVPGLSWATERLPSRPLGKTGIHLPIIGLDGRVVSHGEVAKTQALIDAAIEQGFTFFNTSMDYMDGGADRRLGKCLTPKYRDQIFLQSRCKARTKGILPKILDVALARCRVDYFDSFLLESKIEVTVDEQVEQPPPDVFEGLITAREAGKIRVAGIRSMADTSYLQELLDLYGSKVDVVMLPKSTPPTDGALVKARKLGIGIIADVDKDAQKQWKTPKQTGVIHDYTTSWVLTLGNPAQFKTYFKRAMSLKES